jgi:aspartate racemase
MSAVDRPIIGILGGMGPEATVDLMRRVIAATSAHDDSDHVHLIVDSNPQVPSRIAALIDGTGQSPAPELVRMARRLEAAGADYLAIACNTAHAYAAEIRGAVAAPIIDMIDLTVREIAGLVMTHRRVGILASTAVLKLGLYTKAFAPHDISLIAPDRQADLMEIVKAVKRGDTGRRNGDQFAKIAGELLDKPIDLLLIACTELSVLSGYLDPNATCIDALDVLTNAIVARGLSLDR